MRGVHRSSTINIMYVELRTPYLSLNNYPSKYSEDNIINSRMWKCIIDISLNYSLNILSELLQFY